MIDHPFKPHEVWKDRDSCEERLHDPNDENIYGICGAPRSAHMDSEHALKVQLATALRELAELLEMGSSPVIDHPFKAHEAWKDRDMCEFRIDSGDGSGMTSACCLPRRAHPTAEALRIAELEATKNAAYAERNQCVALLVRMALTLGWRAGVRDHEDKPGEEWESDWRNLVCIDLPTGQVSWHFHDSEKPLLAGLPQYPASWDGHDTAEKYRRVNAALATEATDAS